MSMVKVRMSAAQYNHNIYSKYNKRYEINVWFQIQKNNDTNLAAIEELIAKHSLAVKLFGTNPLKFGWLMPNRPSRHNDKSDTKYRGLRYLI